MNFPVRIVGFLLCKGYIPVQVTSKENVFAVLVFGDVLY